MEVEAGVRRRTGGADRGSDGDALGLAALFGAPLGAIGRHVVEGAVLLGLAVAVSIYLVYVIIHPEKF